MVSKNKKQKCCPRNSRRAIALKAQQTRRKLHYSKGELCSSAVVTLSIKTLPYTKLLIHLKNLYDKLRKLPDDVKQINRTLNNKITISKSQNKNQKRNSRKAISSKGQQTRRKLDYSKGELCSTDCKYLKEQTVNQYLQMMMKQGIKENSIKDQNMGTFFKRKSEFTILVHTRKDSNLRDDLKGTFAKACTKGEQRETLLESFMYRDYTNGFSTAPNNLELYPLIVSSRNVDYYVDEELHSSLLTGQSEGVFGTRTCDSRSFISLHSMHLELIRLETFRNFTAWRTISTVKLAKEGFYYSDPNDNVTCFSCRFEKNGWKVSDDPTEVHRQKSPTVPSFRGIAIMFENKRVRIVLVPKMWIK